MTNNPYTYKEMDKVMIGNIKQTMEELKDSADKIKEKKRKVIAETEALVKEMEGVSIDDDEEVNIIQLKVKGKKKIKKI